MPFDDYTLDPYTGGVRFRDSETGAEMLTTPEAGRARMQDIDAARAYSSAAPPELAPPAPMSLEAPVAMPRPEPMPSLGERGALAISPEQARADLERLRKMGSGITGALNAFGQAAKNFWSSGGQTADTPPGLQVEGKPLAGPGAAPIFSPQVKQAAKELITGRPIQTMTGDQPANDLGAPPDTALGEIGEDGKWVGGRAQQAAPAAPGAAPAEGAPVIVRTDVTPQAEAAKPAAPQTATETTTTTTSTGGTEKSSLTRTEREFAVGMSPTAATNIFNAMNKQGLLRADQADKLAKGQLDVANLTDEQARIFNAAANDAAVRQSEVEYQTLSRYARAEEYQRQAMDMRVDPARMWKNASTGQKIQLGIAALLGAWGSALQGKQENMGVKIIDDAIKRDVDLQMQDIAAKREGANETVRMAKLLMEQGATSREAADYIRNLQILSATERAKAIAQRAGTWRAEDIDPTTGMPRPGTRSFAANEALINANLQARQFVGAWEAERAGKERQTTEQAVKNASQTQKSVAKREVPLESESVDMYKGKPFFVTVTPEGKRKVMVMQNTSAVDPKEITKKAALFNLAQSEISKLRVLLSKVNVRTGINPQERKLITEGVGFIRSIALEQGVVREPEAQRFMEVTGSLTEGKDVLDAIQGLFTKATSELEAQAFAEEVNAKDAQEILRSRKFRQPGAPSGSKLGDPWPIPLLINRRRKRFAFSTRTITRCSYLRAMRSVCYRVGKAMAWLQGTRFPCAFLASVMSRWSTQAKPCRCSSNGSAKLLHLKRTSASARKPNLAASVAPLARRLLASSKARQQALATPRWWASARLWARARTCAAPCAGMRPTRPSRAAWARPPASSRPLWPRWPRVVALALRRRACVRRRLVGVP
jgi:hypothetical protein